MLATCSGNRLSLVLGLVIQYLSGEDTFSGRVPSRDHFTFIQILAGSSWAVVSPGRPPTGLMQTYHTPGGYHPHAKDLLFYFLSYTKVGLFISFSGCLGLLAGVCRFWRVFAGFGLFQGVLRGVGGC